MKKIFCKNFGFTLLELLVVVTIVGILASTALPQFGRTIIRSRVAEGSNMMGALLTAEFVYYQEHSTFTAATADLLVTVPAPNITWFNYGIQAANTNNAQVIATGNATTVNGGNVPSTVTVTGTINANGTRTIVLAGI